MVNKVMVNKSLSDTRVITRRGAEFGDNVHVTEAVPAEFSSLAGFYPILITRTSDEGPYAFIAMLGLEAGENLYLDGDRWDAGYIPLSIRRQPFTLLQRDIRKEDGSIASAPGLAIDLDSPRISRDGEGEALMDSDGTPSEWFRQINAIMQTLVNGFDRARDMLQRLDQLGLIKPLNYGVTGVDGRSRKLEGLYGIDEQRLREVSDDVVIELHRKGYLDCLYCMRASLGHIGRLAQLKNRRLETEAGLNRA